MIKKDAAKMQPRDAAMMQPGCSQDAARDAASRRCSHGAAMMQPGFKHDTLLSRESLVEAWSWLHLAPPTTTQITAEINRSADFSAWDSTIPTGGRGMLLTFLKSLSDCQI